VTTLNAMSTFRTPAPVAFDRQVTLRAREARLNEIASGLGLSLILPAGAIALQGFAWLLAGTTPYGVDHAAVRFFESGMTYTALAAAGLGLTAAACAGAAAAIKHSLRPT
jgi:hypothetical protein